DECVVAVLVDLHGVRKALVDRTHVREPATGRDECERRTALAAEENFAPRPKPSQPCWLQSPADAASRGGRPATWPQTIRATAGPFSSGRVLPLERRRKPGAPITWRWSRASARDCASSWVKSP